MRADLVFKNARIYGLEREGESFAAMRVDGEGRIAELYPEGAPLPRSPNAVDLGGRAVVPAFIDAHAHFMSKAGLDALAVKLGSLEGGRFLPDSLEGVRDILFRRAAESERGIVFGFGLCIGALAERRLPRASELDAWLPGRAVVVLSMDGHSSSYSSLALAEMGLGSLAEDGLLAGEAHEFNMGRVTSYVMRGLGPTALARGLSAAVAEAAASGLSTVHCLEGSEGQARDLPVAALALLGPSLPLRLRLWLQYTDLAKAKRYAKSLGRPRAGGCLAWEMDGSVSSRSAAFDRPYLDRDHAGKPYRSADEAYALVEPFYRSGWQTSAHAIGPRGIESILAAYERVMGESGDESNRLRLRIDHFEFPRPDQVERAGKRRLVLTAQPGFAWADERFLGMYREALDERARASLCPLRSLVEVGAVVALSTDAPVQSLNPFVQIAGAVEHPVASESLSVYQALRAYTWAGAYSTFEESERGTLAVGKRADFAVLDRDPFEIAASELSEVRVLETRIDGKKLEAPPPEPLAFALRALCERRRKL